MTSTKHNKHAKLSRPSFGNYCRNEWSILGSGCEVIQDLAADVIKALSPAYKAAYLDATHKEATDEVASPTLMTYLSHPSKEQFQFNKKFTPFTFRELFNEADVAFVNGNHLKASAQVIIIDEAKRASLQKRTGDLSDLQLILLKEEASEIFDFIKLAIPYWEQVPVFLLTEKEKIAAFFQEKMKRSRPLVNALVLAGGQSMRMGQDKTVIHWHGKEQRYYMADLLQSFTNEVFISCRKDQEAVDANYKFLTDSFTDLGPYGAILSAFRYNPDVAWLVVASDLPLLDHPTLNYLLENRKSSCIATTFIGDDTQPEPLITIWEPKSYRLLLAQLSQGYSCPRKLLLNNHVHLLKAPDQHALLNVNTPEQAELARKLLKDKSIKA